MNSISNIPKQFCKKQSNGKCNFYPSKAYKVFKSICYATTIDSFISVEKRRIKR